MAEKPASTGASRDRDVRGVCLSGWGSTAPTAASVVRPSDDDQLVRELTDASNRGVIARGLGRSYGDAAQNAGGVVVDMTSRAKVCAVDGERGLAVVDAGVSIDQLLRAIVPMGWFVPVTPGTRQVTIGGAIASDIHGKNHHVHGTFCNHVVSLDLLTAGSDRRTVSPTHDSSVYWATAGGMGLTGIIVRATIRLLPIESALMKVDTERAHDLDDLFDRLASTDHRYTYSVAWIDCMAKGNALGRSVLTRGWHAPRDDLPKKQQGGQGSPETTVAGALTFSPKSRLRAPRWFPSGLLNPRTVAAFNELWFRKAPEQRRGELQSIAKFFHPLDGVVDWNRVYGRQGFVQYQFVVPFEAQDTVRAVLERLRGSGHASFLGVLKRFGDANPGHLSFPTAGWTLALDLPVVHTLGGLLDGIDELVAAAGGRVYLSKDSRLRPELLGAMYPRLDEWRQVRHELDPKGVFVSDLSRRLRL